MASLLRPESGQEELPSGKNPVVPSQTGSVRLDDGVVQLGDLTPPAGLAESVLGDGPQRLAPRNKVAGNFDPSTETSASASATALCALRVPGRVLARHPIAPASRGCAVASEAASIDDDGADGCPDPLSVRPTPRLGYPWAPTGAAWWTGALPTVPTANAVPTRTAAINCRERLAGSLTVDRPDSQARTSAATQIVNHAQPIHAMRRAARPSHPVTWRASPG